MESRFVCLVMVGLVAAMVTARLWVEGRMRGRRGATRNGEDSTPPGAITEGLEEKGNVCEWRS
jgi:hypothetical protein